MGNRRISRQLNGNVRSSCVTPAYMNGLETMALTEKQGPGLRKHPGKKNRGNQES